MDVVRFSLPIRGSGLVTLDDDRLLDSTDGDVAGDCLG
jgi:hypothetical protein